MKGLYAYKSYLNTLNKSPKEYTILKLILVKGYVKSDDKTAEDLDSDPEYTENNIDELLTEEGVTT